MTCVRGCSSAHMLYATQRSSSPPANTRPVTLSNCVASTANVIRKMRAMPTPSIRTRRRSLSGRPDASDPMMTTLSPAIVRSPMMIWPSFASPPAVASAPKLRLGKPTIAPLLLLIHAGEEVLVGLGVLHLVEEELHRVHRAHLHEDATKHPHLGENVLLDEQLFLASAGLADIQRREDALVGDLAVEDDFRVARALELFEDDLVHLGPRVDQRSGDDR